jgi:DNA-binding MarR family transcriptional regulator
MPTATRPLRPGTGRKPAGGAATRPTRARAPAEAEAPDLLLDSLGYAIKSAQVRTYAVLFRVVGPAQLSPARMTALSLIGSEPGIGQAALAQRLRITAPSMVKVVDALQDMDLVNRESLPDDGRRYALVLTPRGRAKLAECKRLLDEYEREIAARLSDEERATLIRLLDKVATDTNGEPD